MASEPDPADTTPPPAAPAPPATASGGRLFNLARGLKGIALLLFLIPWVTVSCGGTELVSMSGYDLATGAISVRNPMTGQVETPPANAGSGGGRGSDMWVIAAAGLIVAGLVLTFVLPRAVAALLAAVASIGAAGLIGYTVLARLPAEMREQPMAPPGAAGGGGSAADMGMNAQQLAAMIKVEPQLGFWLLLAALVAAAVLNIMARGRAGP